MISMNQKCFDIGSDKYGKTSGTRCNNKKHVYFDRQKQKKSFHVTWGFRSKRRKLYKIMSDVHCYFGKTNISC